MVMFVILLVCATGALAKYDVLPAKFSLETFFDYETSPWGPKLGEEYLYSMRISCAKYLDPMPLRSPWKSTIVPQVIKITNCSLSTTPFAEVFRKMDFDITKMNKLRLASVSLPPSIPDDYLAGLSVKIVELSNISNFPTNFFMSLETVYKLSVEDMELSELKVPGTFVVMNLRNAAIKNMVNCDRIQDVKMVDVKEDQIYKWPDRCGGMLWNLHMESMTPSAVRQVGKSKPYFGLQTLTIKNCSIVELPKVFLLGFGGAGFRLFTVKLPNNNLEDEAFLQFPKLSSVITLDLSYNRLKGECLRKILPNVAIGLRTDHLRQLYLDGNQFTDVFDDYEIKSALANLPAITELSLNWMQLKPDCLKHTSFKQLTTLGLATNSSELIENLQLHHLPKTGARQLIVNLRGRSVRTVHVGPNFTENFDNLNKSSHWLTNKGFKLVVLLDFVDCECNNDILQRALKKYPEHINMPALKCNSKDGDFFLNEPMENLNCRKATVNGCKRKLSRETNYTTVVDCSYVGDKFSWPRPRGFRGLNASGNGISSLLNADLPDSLEWLDLRNNNISSLAAEDITRLFGSHNRRLWLENNPIECNCGNRALLEALYNNQAQIVDYLKLKCFRRYGLGEELLIKDIFVFELCKSGYSHNDFGNFGIPKKYIDKEIFCPGNFLDEAKPFPEGTSFNTLSVHDCKISRVYMADVLKSLNVNLGDLRTLKLINVKIPVNLDRHHSAGMGIRNLILVNIENFSSNFFTYLGDLRRLRVEDMVLPYLPASNHIPLFHMILKNSTVRSWDNCIHLQDLRMSFMNKENISGSWPHECAGLRILSMHRMTPETVQHVIMSTNETYLRELYINNCELKESPLSLMQNLDRLNILDLSYNKLEDHAFSQFPHLRDLKVLNLAENNLKGDFLSKVIPKILQLQALELYGNNFVHIFQKFEIKSALTSLQSLQRLELSDMTLDADCLMYSNFSKLTYLGLRARVEQKPLLMLHGLPMTRATQLMVDLSGRSFRSVQIDDKFYDNFNNQNILDLWITKKGYYLNLRVDYVDCVCNNDVLATALRDFSRFLYMPDLRCDSKDGVPFIDEPIENLNCLKATVHGCKRRISRDFDYITTVDCSYNKEKFRWPRPDKRYYSLNASGNHITSLDNAYIPDTLKRLDLRNNDISYLDAEQSSLLFSIEERRVWLFGNPIVCECANRFLLNSLKVNHSQIPDYDALTCVNNGQLVRLVSIDELCRFKHEYVWGTCIALAVLALFAAIILRHYWISLRIYLYARGYCLSCLHEEDVDEDRPFDAFLSFAHGDDQYVMEQLLPQLEGEPNYYRICVHYRDWGVGEWIPAQIMQSVRLSKRTIIVLSKNFVTSLWGAMEFRYALASMESEGRSRLLVLVLDDVLSENLAPELRNYLNLNTYLRCDDPWFWGKLRFAMPHTQRSPESEEASCHDNISTLDGIPMVAMQTRNNLSDLVNRTEVEDDEIRTHEFRTV